MFGSSPESRSSTSSTSVSGVTRRHVGAHHVRDQAVGVPDHVDAQIEVGPRGLHLISERVDERRESDRDPQRLVVRLEQVHEVGLGDDADHAILLVDDGEPAERVASELLERVRHVVVGGDRLHVGFHQLTRLHTVAVAAGIRRRFDPARGDRR